MIRLRSGNAEVSPALVKRWYEAQASGDYERRVKAFAALFDAARAAGVSYDDFMPLLGGAFDDDGDDEVVAIKAEIRQRLEGSA